ncbi:MAG: hypothetical protein C0594_12560 [Marinilabiliales bacterium]|nr:MAG: hypothetical protein C0594_12560 [Marinilabiliales bacterium]
MKRLEYIKINDWWTKIIPPTLGFYFIGVINNQHIPEMNYAEFLLFFLCILFTTIFSYTLKEITDIKDDKEVGKKNKIEILQQVNRIILLLLPIIAACILFVFITNSIFLIGLFIFQVIMLILHSVEPIRLKRNKFLSFILYVFSNGVIFYIIAFVLSMKSNLNAISLLNISLIATWGTIKGIRNTLVHQITNRQKYKKNGSQSLTSFYGPLRLIKMINSIIIPIELIFIALFFSQLTERNMFLIALGIFLIYQVFILSIWKLLLLQRRYFLKKFLHFLDNFYEAWLPLISLIYLCIQDATFLYLLSIFVVLFPIFIARLSTELSYTLKKSRVLVLDLVLIVKKIFNK